MLEKKVLVIGAGRMGYGVTKTLISKGYEVTVSDPSEAAVEKAIEIGAKASENLNDSISNNKIIIFSLPTAKLVEEIVETINSVPVSEERFMIDLSTIDPKTAKEAAKKSATNGSNYIEAPVSGGPGGAETGTLSIMVGAKESAFKSVEPVLNDIGKNIYYLGEVGTASVVKICNNIIVAATTTALSEAFILASAEGVSPSQLKDVLEHSVGGSNTLNVFGHHFVSGDYSEPTFALAHMHKDVGLFAEAAKHYGLTSFIGTLATQIYNGAYAQGLKDEDHSAVCKFIEQMNNKQIQRN